MLAYFQYGHSCLIGSVTCTYAYMQLQSLDRTTERQARNNGFPAGIIRYLPMSNPRRGDRGQSENLSVPSSRRSKFANAHVYASAKQATTTRMRYLNTRMSTST
jgi:hypothetical protein